MFKVLCAALVIASPAAAKSWSDVSCSVGLVSEEGGFTFQPHDSDAVRCTIADWPISRPEAQLACSDGSTPILIFLSEGRLVFNGIEMFEVTETGPICD